MLSKMAYHLASLLFEGVFTLHEFRAALLAYGVPEEAIPKYLKGGFAELCSHNLVTWEFIANYGGGPSDKPPAFDAPTFLAYWNRCFGDSGPTDCIPDRDHPTLGIEPSEELAREIDGPQYQRYVL